MVQKKLKNNFDGVRGRTMQYILCKIESRDTGRSYLLLFPSAVESSPSPPVHPAAFSQRPPHCGSQNNGLGNGRVGQPVPIR